MAILATTASAAPFIGLFGTVWGVMVTFTDVAVTVLTDSSRHAAAAATGSHWVGRGGTTHARDPVHSTTH